MAAPRVLVQSVRPLRQPRLAHLLGAQPLSCQRVGGVNEAVAVKLGLEAVDERVDVSGGWGGASFEKFELLLVIVQLLVQLEQLVLPSEGKTSQTGRTEKTR